MADSTATAPAQQTGKTKKQKYQIKKGGSDEKLIKLLKRHKGEMTIEELAPMVERRGGDVGIEPDSLASQVSKIKNAMIRAGVDAEKVKAIMPKGFSDRRGRGEAEVASKDDLLALLEGDDDEGDDDENENG